jgi:3-deoxy-D-manno-octulosonic-acid transferase
MYPLYTLAFAAAVTGYAPVALVRQIVRGVPLNLRERLGLRAHQPPPAPCGWIHAVSVGEAIAAAPLLEGLRRRWPALPLVVSTVTETGARVVRKRFAGLASHRYLPLDFPGAARRVVASIRPAFFVGMETNVAESAAHAGRWRRGRWWPRGVIARVRRYLWSGMMRACWATWRFGISRTGRRRISRRALRRVVVTSASSTGAAIRPAPGPLAPARRTGSSPVWIAGSTHRGEEGAVLDAHVAARVVRPDLALVIAPRHPERVGEVISLVTARGFVAVRRSELPGRALDPGATVIVLDTVGELAQLYSIADVVFVGGSLAPFGGHNMLEPATAPSPCCWTARRTFATPRRCCWTVWRDSCTTAASWRGAARLS